MIRCQTDNSQCVGGTGTSRKSIGIGSPQQHIDGTKNILFEGCTITGVRKCVDFFFWVHIKSSPPVEGIARISVATERINDTPEIFQNIWNSIQRHCQAYQTTSNTCYSGTFQ
ncbi:hypothetical protein TNCV_41071 [Trichonephila clavipes]|nr:hypothetical protein TNCV_41071 [Trichonephila clavipes]